MALLINTLYNVDAIFLLVNTSMVLWRDDPPQQRTLFRGTVSLPLDVCHLRPCAVELPRQAFPLRLHPNDDLSATTQLRSILATAILLCNKILSEARPSRSLATSATDALMPSISLAASSRLDATLASSPVISATSFSVTTPHRRGDLAPL